MFTSTERSFKCHTKDHLEETQLEINYSVNNAENSVEEFLMSKTLWCSRINGEKETNQWRHHHYHHLHNPHHCPNHHLKLS